MKKFKIVMAAVVALSLVFTVSAFKKSPKKASTTMAWFTYNGAVNGELIPNNYTYIGTEPCNGTGALCAVQAFVEDDSGDQSGWKPSEESLSDLADNSNDFTTRFHDASIGDVRLEE
jgi:hypothetical protein